MKRQITFRLLVMLLTASLLLSSTGLLTMFAKAEELTTAPTLVTEGSTVGDNIGSPSTTAGKPETTTKPQTTVPNTEQSTTLPATNSAPTVVAEGGALDASGPSIKVEGGPTKNGGREAVVWTGTDTEAPTVNMGKSSNPYAVSSAAHFLAIQALINDTSNTDKYFSLTADIDLSTVTSGDFLSVDGFSASLLSLSWVLAVNNPTKIFINLNGQGFKIKNLNVTNSSKDTFAIFGHITEASIIQNIAFENCSLAVTYASAVVSAVVAVQNMGVIRDCSFTGVAGVATLDMSATEGSVLTSETATFAVNDARHVVRLGSAVFVGDNQGTIEHCTFSDISILIKQRNIVGGIVAQNSGTITGINGVVNNLIAADYGIEGIKITSVPGASTEVPTQIGGIAGKNRFGATISNCTVDLAGVNDAMNSFTYCNKVGGVAGVNAGTVDDCYVLGKVNSTQTLSISSYDMLGKGFTFGGITGENTGLINGCSAENIGMYFESTPNAIYGGITGTNAGNGTTTGLISDCYASGKQSDIGSISFGNYYIGGIVGSASAGTLLSNCYALVSLTQLVDNALRAGALIGNGAKADMLSTSSPNYWSRTVSNWPTQGALDSSDTNDIHRGVKALNLAKNTQKPVNKDLFTHTWGGADVSIVDLGTASAFSKTSPNLSISETNTQLNVTGGPTASTFGDIFYTLNIVLPSGVGASVQPTNIRQQMSVSVVTTDVAPSEPVVTFSNPIVINNATEMLFVKSVPTADYKLGADITMLTGALGWQTSVFAGTLDGNNKTITSHIPVFSKIYGSRDEGPDSQANLAYGYVFDLKLVLNANSNAGMLGSVIGGTVKNTTLTGSAPGIALTINATGQDKRGAFIDVARGNSYIVDCFTDLKVNITDTSVGYIGGLIGNIDGNKVTVENCGSNSDVYSLDPLAAIASLIGGITNSTGTVKNCFAGGLVQRGGYIAVGNKLASHKLENLYWSIKDINTANQATVLPAPNISATDTVIKWSFEEAIGYVSDEPSYINLILPAALPPQLSITKVIVSDFSVEIRDSNQITTGTPTKVGSGPTSRLKIQVFKHQSEPLNINTVVTVVHGPTGMRARVTINSGISKNIDGYYEIKTPGNLQQISEKQALYLPEGVNFKMKLMNDIDMYDAVNDYQYTYTPIGDTASSKRFKGVFDGNNYTIKNLVINGTYRIAMFAQTQGATINNLTLDGARITASGQSVACIAAIAQGGSIHDITVKNSSIVSTYDAGGGSSYTGGIVGNYLANVGNSPLENITIDKLSISSSVSLLNPAAGLGSAGGVVGYIPSNATVAINTVNITDLDLTGGKEKIGGVVGAQAGNVTIQKVTMNASTGTTPQISGIGYVGGIVGYSVSPSTQAKITDCSLTGMTITNTGTSQVGAGATGGIAAWFSGTIGDDPATTEVVEECTVQDCTIQGMIVGGILGRVDSATTGNNRNITIKNCNVTGTTTVTATTSPTAAAAGILAEYLPTTNSILVIDTCRVHSGVIVKNGRYVAGILGAVTFATPGKVEVKNCQSFADVVADPDITTTYAGAVIGYCNANVNVTKITNCVAGGSVRAKTATGGLLGYMNNPTAFSAGTRHISGCYVTALLPGMDGDKGKIWGNASNNTPLPESQIANAINYVVYSSYPEDIPPYGGMFFNSYPTTKLTFADINKPNINDPTLYQHGSATAVVLTDSHRTETITASNIPGGRIGDFAYDPAFGWVSQSTARLRVDAYTPYTPTQITVTALRSTNINTGIVAAYLNSSYDIYPSQTVEKLTFLARIPVFCEGIENQAWIGEGILTDPFQIWTKDDLDEMRFNVLQDDNAVNYFGGYYKLMGDIAFDPADFELGGDFEGGFIPLTGGTSKLAFVGDFDGGGHAITGLRITNKTGDYTGLFEQAGKKTIYLNGSDQDVYAVYKDLTISDAIMEGYFGCAYGGTLVAKADSTLFTGITIDGATLSNIKTYAGGIVGYAENSTVEGFTRQDYTGTYIPVTVSGSSVKVNPPGKAGGIAGSFGVSPTGSIGRQPDSGDGWDVTVVNTVVEGDDAGGIVGHNKQLPLTVTYTLVSDCSVESKIPSPGYAAGGILGRADDTGDNPVVIEHTKVDDLTTVTAVSLAGGIVGKMAVQAVGATKLLTLDHIESYAAVLTTGEASGISGGIVGSMTNALVVEISNGVAGGSVEGKTEVGGIIGVIEGTDPALSLQNITTNFVINFVVSADIVGAAGASVGLVLGYCQVNLMQPGPYAKNPFENIKYSSYQYAPDRLIIGNGAIDSTQSPNFKKTIFDLNKGLSDEWIEDPASFTEDTYMGLRYDDGSEVTMNLILGNDPVQLSASNILLPVFPEPLPRTLDFIDGGNFTEFEDKQGINFTLTGVTSNIENLITYTPGTPGDPNAPGTGTLVRNTGEGAGNLIFTYTNGLRLALKLISYEDLIGAGTAGNPYRISRTSHFDLIRTLPAKYYEQINDIAFDAGEFDPNGSYYNGGFFWEPLKGTSSFFTGQYNGGGFTVSGLKVARPSKDYVGFFAKINQGAKVYDLTLANATIVGRDYVGALAGEVTGTGTATPVSNCHVLSSSVTSTTPGANQAPIRIGGLVALEKSASAMPTVAGIKDCTVTSTEVTTYIGDYTYAGGIAALAQSIENCTVDNITVNAGLRAGGIVAGSGTTTTGGPNNPMSIKGCTVSSVNGASQIKASTPTGTTVSAGIIAYLVENIQLSVENCNVTELVAITSTNGAAGGIMGVLNSQGTNPALTLLIKNAQSYATVTGLFESGGILGAIKGDNFELSRALIEGCTGAGHVASTSSSLQYTGVGGIIGSVKKTSGADFSLPMGAFIKECVASAILTAPTTPAKVTAVGKLVGDCGTGLSAWTYESYPDAFKDNYISSYPQDTPVFGNGFMMGMLKTEQNRDRVYKDLMVYKINDEPMSAFTVQNIVDGSPSGDFREVAITPYDTPAVTTYFNGSVKVQSGTSFSELDDINPVYIDGYHGLLITGISATTQATTINSSFALSGAQRQLKIDVTPTLEEAGFLEVGLGYGLKISVPIVTFDVTGIGTAGSPFEIETVKHMTLMYYLPTAHFIQMNDINIDPDLSGGDYAPGVYNTATEKIEGRGDLYQAGWVGFRPVGAPGKPFIGSYNGQNHKVTGIYSNNVAKDYVGFFGYVGGASTLENIHIELTVNTSNEPTYGNLGGILGRDYVGGLAGWCSSSTTVENCSVAFGQVAGKFYVGGLIGQSSTSMNECFTNCDVVAIGNKVQEFSGEAGGLVGRVTTNATVPMTINKSFATGSIYSEVQHAGGLIGRINNGSTSIIRVTDCFFTGDVKAAATVGSTANAASIIIGSGPNQGRADGSNILVAGTNVSFKGTMSPFAAFTSVLTERKNIYYDKSLLGFTTADPGTVPSTTADLTGATLPTGFLPENWTAVAGSYPRLIMADSYSNAFCAAATIPLKLDAIDLENRTVVDGLRFQPSIANTIPGVTGASITFKASKLDTTDTLSYPADYDGDLYGNGSDRNIDLLFKDNDGGTTTIYRNIFRTDMTSDFDLQNFRVHYGELLYSRRTPIVTLSATVDGTAVFKRIKLPLESAGNRYYLATERQLRALSYGSNDVAPGTKFLALVGAVNSYNARVHLTADVKLCDTAFTPIKLFRGIFNGNGFAVQRLKITDSGDNVGLFDKLESLTLGLKVEVQNLNIEDAWISGRNNVGALTGYANELSKISNCSVSGADGSKVTGNERVGGLVGWAKGGIIGDQSRAAVPVNGINSVGGFVGVSSATIESCFATGPVTATIDPALSGGVETDGAYVYGVGGFAGAIRGGEATLSFATGNVTVSRVEDFVNIPRDIGIGGFVGIISPGNVLKCFASGAVKANEVNAITSSSVGSLMFGIGGVAGINRSQLSQCYSSSAVFANFEGAVIATAGARVAAGIGGVAGVALDVISDAYSSGSVLREPEVIPEDNTGTYFKSAIGGVIGTTVDVLQPGFTLLYFDLWNNSYGSTLKAIGGIADTATIRSLTTDQMCISDAVRRDIFNPSPLQLSTNTWSFNDGAYPCLQELVVDSETDKPTPPYIRYPAVLSVVAVIPDSRDISARTGNGITMAITTPGSLTILGQTYELDWSVADDSDVFFIDKSEGTTSKFVPVRTSNNSQILSLIASIKNNSQYGTRRFERLCAEMRGTPTKPYLISHKSDLQHIGLPTYTEYQVTGFDGYYNQWYSPLNDSLVNVAGIVHFKLLSDIDMRLDVNYTYNSGEDRLDVVVNSAGDGNRDNDNHHIPYLTNASYNGIIFEGISFAGNDYSIDYFKSAREFIFGISSVSTISDISFENLQIDSTGTVDEDLGTALVRYNQGTIDGCMILSGDIKGGNNVASIVVNNQATLKNSTVKASITGKANVGGIVTSNLAGGTITNCAFDDGLITVNQIVGEDAKAGAIAGSNSGTISNCFSMGSIVSTNYANVIGGLVGENTSTGIIGPAYSRTHVSGGDIIGGFVGTNAGTITNAFSAGRVTLSSGYTQTDIFCGTNTGTLTDTFADKAMAGKSTYALLDDVTTTQELMDMTCFSTTGTASNVFTESSTESAYPQLTAILALDNGYATGAYIPQKFELLIGYSILSSAAIKTKYSQYIDTLALSTANPVSTITTTESWLTDVSWSTNDLSIIDAEGLTTATSGSTTLTASITINASNGKTHPITMPIAVTTGDQNLNFNGGDGRTDTPYQINSTDSFSSLAYYGPNPEISYVLTDDINYDDGCPNPVITTFSGTLDGAQHVVYDLTLDADSAGLFGHLNGATVSNLGLVGAKKVTTVPGDYTGLLAGLAQDATITNCYAIGEMEVDSVYMGGLVGYANAGTTITGCVTSGKFINTSAAATAATAATGGIIGGADTTSIVDCFSTAYVKGDGVVGGIVGEAINSSTITGCTFAGMVMDSELADGTSEPAITTIGNIVGSKSANSTITGCAYDKQITLIADANATAKFTGELMTGSAYTVHTGLAGGNAKFAAGVAFGTMPIRFLLGSSAGSTQSFSKISLPGTIAGDAISVVEIPQHTVNHLDIGTGSPIIINLLANLDLADVYAGIEIELDTVNGSVFSGMANNVLRYTQPRLNRIVTVSYTLANSSGVGALDGETVAVMLKNTHLFAGDPVTYSSDAFTNVNQSLISPALFENLVVSSGGIYAGGNLPEGYNYQITATDQADIPLPVTIVDGEYGTHVALKDDTTGIKLSYTIIKNEPWGVFVYWSSLVDTLVK